MTCHICGRHEILHGGHIRPGSESGCHDGVWMDDDVHAEGWEPDTVYPPCPHNPACCDRCGGPGQIAGEELHSVYECEACEGTGWKEGKAQWPSLAEPEGEVMADEKTAREVLADEMSTWGTCETRDGRLVDADALIEALTGAGYVIERGDAYAWRSINAWHEDCGPVEWGHYGEAPWVGTAPPESPLPAPPGEAENG